MELEGGGIYLLAGISSPAMKQIRSATFHASAALFWDVTQSKFVVIYRCL